GEIRELDAVTDPLFPAQNEEIVPQWLAGPAWKRRRLASLRYADTKRKPTLEPRPSVTPIADQQVEVPHVVEDFIVVRRLRQGRVGVGARFLSAPKLDQDRGLARAQPGGERRVPPHHRECEHVVEDMSRVLKPAQFLQCQGATEMGRWQVGLQERRLF